jgi:hypothetical protein
MRPTPSAIAQIMDVLAETPRRITRACDGVADNQLTEKSDSKSWSVLENLAHLRACADVWGASIEEMLEVDGATQRKISPRTYIRRTNYLRSEFRDSLAAFAMQRESLLQMLHSLAPDDWSHSATIDGRVHTVFTQARRMALHERDHLEQIEKTVASLLNRATATIDQSPAAPSPK